MANFWDGSQYVGLDDEAFGDGDSDLTTLPLDTYIENVIDGNHRWINKNKDHVTVSPAIDYVEASKRFCSYDSFAIKDLVKIPVQQGSVIRLLLNGGVFTDTTALGEGELRVRLVSFSSEGELAVFDTATVARDEDDGSWHEVVLGTSDVPDEFTSVWAEFSFRNTTEPETVGEVWGILSTVGAGTIELNKRVGGVPASLLFKSSARQQAYSHVLTQDGAGNVQVYPRYVQYEDDIWQTSYWKFFSWEWEVEGGTDTNVRYGNYEPRPSISMLPNVAVRGRDAFIQATNYETLAKTKRLTAVPRTGERAPTGGTLYWPSSERPEFAYLSAGSEYLRTGLAGSTYDLLDRFVVNPKTEKCNLEINFWSGYFFTGTYAGYLKRLVENGLQDEVRDITFRFTAYDSEHVLLDTVEVEIENYLRTSCEGNEDPFLQREIYGQFFDEASSPEDTRLDPLYSYQDGIVKQDSYEDLTNITAVFRDLDTSGTKSILIEVTVKNNWDDPVFAATMPGRFQQVIFKSYFPSVIEEPILNE